MRNKFEALNAFQSWPEDWQRLCAEYWAENDKPQEKHDVSSRQQCFSGIPSENTQKAKRPSRTGKGLLSPPWTLSDDQLIVRLHDSGMKRHEIVKQLLLAGVKRTKHAIASRHCFLRRKNWQVG